ncbi:hypothetical protein [Acidovorax sp. sic0104]|uniref:hypothetical protein n=1 Tax=Acidovorax sp. sic0104 TaxID=2854784 RepID=UPI001C464404|nr:hypothetical protein [Acidovorax sp. sic0104]MBV7539850.1 hypothetical protein [Acidovorax sp. sic0104]
MKNLFQAFKEIFPDAPRQIGEVLSHEAGVATVSFHGGGIAQAIGDATPGQYVFVRDGVIEGEAPNLPVVDIEI